MTNGWQIYWIPGLLSIKVRQRYICLPDRLTDQTTTHLNKRRKRRIRTEHSQLQGRPPLMGTLGVYQNILAFDTKLMHSLGIYSIGPPLVMDKLIPINSIAIASPPEMGPCLMSNASLESSLNQSLFLLRTRITFVGRKRSTSRDKCAFNLSTGLSALQILCQGNTPIASQTADQLTRCFRSTLLLTH